MLASQVMWFGDALRDTPFEYLIEPLRDAFTSESVAVTLSAGVRELEPQPGDEWVRRELTGKRSILIEWED